jgi:trimeric autotransporter adhesin
MIFFGFSVAISQGVIIVGASHDEHNSAGNNPLATCGSVYVFRENAGSYLQTQKLTHSDRAVNDHFGAEVALSGGYLLVGSDLKNGVDVFNNSILESGSVYFFNECQHNTGNFSATACGVYSWNGTNYSSSGVYQQTLVNYYGCDSVVTLNLTINALPTIVAGNDFELCEGQVTVLNATGGSNYSWNNGVLNGVTFVPLVSGTYIVQGEGANGCVNMDTVHIGVYPFPQLSISQTSIVVCENGLVEFTAQVTDVADLYSIQWKYEGNNVGTNSNALSILNPLNGGVVSAELTNHAGCLSTVISNQLSLTVQDVDTVHLSLSICAGTSVLVGEVPLSTQGEHTVVTQSHLGCDSVVVVNLTLITSYFAEDNVIICEGDVYVFGGQSLTVSGLYQEVFINQYGCDSIISLQLYVTPQTSIQEINICSGDSYVFGNQIITTSGQYAELFVNHNGCDSLVILYVTEVPSYNQTITVMICEGDIYHLGTQVLTQPGLYSELFMSSLGCDSTVNVNLGLRFSDYILKVDTICSGSIYDFDGQQITTSGLHYRVYQNQYGCDSVSALELYVTPAPVGTIQYNLCSGQVLDFYGQVISQSGAYSAVLSTVKGCDSILVASVIYFSPTFVSTSEVVCPGETYMFGTTLLNEPGTYVHTFPSMFGCDSTVTLSFSFEPQPSVIYVGAMLWVTSGEQFVWYQNGEIMDGEIYQGYTPLSEGIYTVDVTSENGCVHSIMNPVFASMLDNEIVGLRIYPTLTQDLVFIESQSLVKISVYNMLGELVERINLSNGKISLAGLSNGMYFFQVEDGSNRNVVKVLKE